MKFGFASDAAYPWFNGGMEKRRYLIMRSLVEKGHEVHCFTMYREGMDGREFVWEGIHYHCVGNATPSEKMYVNGRRNIRWPMSYASRVLSKIRKHKLDLIDTEAFPFLHIPPIALYAKLTRTKFLVTWHEVWSRGYWREYLGSLGRIGYRAEKLSASMCENRIAASSIPKMALEKEFKVDGRTIQVFPAAVSSTEINRCFNKRSKKSGRLIVIGRLVPEKRIELAVRAAAESGVKLDVVGRGPEKSRLMEITRRLHASNRIKFYEGIPEAQLSRMIKDASALLMFSEREGLSIVTVEALALGTPVIILESTSLPAELKRLCHQIDQRNIAGELRRLVKDKHSVIYKPKIDRKKVLNEFSADTSEQVYMRFVG